MKLVCEICREVDTVHRSARSIDYLFPRVCSHAKRGVTQEVLRALFALLGTCSGWLDCVLHASLHSDWHSTSRFNSKRASACTATCIHHSQDTTAMGFCGFSFAFFSTRLALAVFFSFFSIAASAVPQRV